MGFPWDPWLIFRAPWEQSRPSGISLCLSLVDDVDKNPSHSHIWLVTKKWLQLGSASCTAVSIFCHSWLTLDSYGLLTHGLILGAIFKSWSWIHARLVVMFYICTTSGGMEKVVVDATNPKRVMRHRLRNRLPLRFTSPWASIANRSCCSCKQPTKITKNRWIPIPGSEENLLIQASYQQNTHIIYSETIIKHKI